MYESVEICVRPSGTLTDSFESYTGVKQGETLSLLLFMLFCQWYETQLRYATDDFVTFEEF